MCELKFRRTTRKEKRESACERKRKKEREREKRWNSTCFSLEAWYSVTTQAEADHKGLCLIVFSTRHQTCGKNISKVVDSTTFVFLLWVKTSVLVGSADRHVYIESFIRQIRIAPLVQVYKLSKFYWIDAEFQCIGIFLKILNAAVERMLDALSSYFNLFAIFSQICDGGALPFFLSVCTL